MGLLKATPQIRFISNFVSFAGNLHFLITYFTKNLILRTVSSFSRQKQKNYKKKLISKHYKNSAMSESIRSGNFDSKIFTKELFFLEKKRLFVARSCVASVSPIDLYKKT